MTGHRMILTACLMATCLGSHTDVFSPWSKESNDISLRPGLAFRCWQLVHFKKESATLLVTHELTIEHPPWRGFLQTSRTFVRIFAETPHAWWLSDFQSFHLIKQSLFPNRISPSCWRLTLLRSGLVYGWCLRIRNWNVCPKDAGMPQGSRYVLRISMS